MLDVFASYATDENLETNGAWFPFGPKDSEGKQARLLIARGGNRNYDKLLSSEVDKNRETLMLSDSPNPKEVEAAQKMNDEIAINVMAETILLGWEGVGFKGALIDYDKANARKLLAVSDFRKLVARFADDRTAYAVKVEVDQGND